MYVNLFYPPFTTFQSHGFDLHDGILVAPSRCLPFPPAPFTTIHSHGFDLHGGVLVAPLSTFSPAPDISNFSPAPCIATFHSRGFDLHDGVLVAPSSTLPEFCRPDFVVGFWLRQGSDSGPERKEDIVRTRHLGLKENRTIWTRTL
jgi:hypothetical protein